MFGAFPVSREVPQRTTTESSETRLCLWSIGVVISNTWPVLKQFNSQLKVIGDTLWRSWVRHCASSPKVAGSIPDGVIGTMTVVDSAWNRHEYQEYFLGGGGKGGRLTTLPPSCAHCIEIWEPQPRGALRGYPGMYVLHFLPQRKHWVFITTIKTWRLFGKHHVCSENHTKPTNTLGGQNAVIYVRATAVPSLANRSLEVGFPTFGDTLLDRRMTIEVNTHVDVNVDIGHCCR